MPLDPAIAVVAISPVMVGAVMGWFSLQLRKNGKNGKPVDPRSNPHGTPIGIVPWAHWEDTMAEMGRSHERFSETLAARYDSTGLAIVTELKALREMTQTHIKLHH